MQRSYKQIFTGLLLFITLLTGPFAAFAQKQAASGRSGGAQTASNQTKTAAKGECKGNYTGMVTYNRTIKNSYSGKYGSTYSRTYVYQSQIAIRDDGSTQGTVYKDYNGIGGSFNFTGKATASLSESVHDLQVSEKDDYCKLTLKGAQGKTRVHCASLSTIQGQASGSGDVNVFLGFNGNKYKISLDNPRVSGTMTQASNSKCSGTCTKTEPIEHTRTSEIKDEKQNGSYTDEQPMDPNNINRLSGSHTRTSGNEYVTITWNLARCAPPMQIEDLRFEHHRFPDPTAWHGVDQLTGTTDGNLVRVKARVFNNTGATGYATVKFTDATTGDALPDGSVSVAVDAGATRDVEYEWDTSGYAWDENRKPKSLREIKAEIQGGNSVTEKIRISPKPVVMAHGLWSNAEAWAEYPGFLREVHSFGWKGYAVGSDPQNGKMSTGDSLGNSGKTNSIYQNAQELAKQIKHTREIDNAWHIDIVAHSMGGLISRQYIHSFMPPVFDGKPAVTHLVMLGTPNMGSPCADLVDNIFVKAGRTEMEAMRELRPSIVRAFNTRVTERKNVKFSVMIGLIMPRTCLDEKAIGDSVVPWQSARYNITDRDYVLRLHTEMAHREDFDWFVLPRLAIGPKKAQSEQQTAWLENHLDNNFAMADRGNANSSFMHNASYGNNTPNEETGPKLSLAEEVQLPANGSQEIDFPVSDGNYAGVLVVASPAIEATLKDASGAVVGLSKGGMEAMKEMFRTIEVRKQFAAGVWKLELKNLGNIAATVYIGGRSATAVASGFTVEAGKPAAAGVVPLTAKWSEAGAPVLGAKITATIAGQSNSVTFLDDGKHNDGAAGDGVYGAATEKLAAGHYALEAKAEANNLSREAVAAFIIGSAASTNGAKAPAAKPPAVKSAARPAAKKKG